MISFRETATTNLWKTYERDRSDIAQRNTLVEHHISFVHDCAFAIARRKNLHSVEHDELVSMGTFGLMDAVERYDPSAGTQFSTFAYPRIKGAIRDGLRSMDPCKRNTRSRLKHIQKRSDTFAHAHGRFPNAHDMEENLQCSQDEINALRLDSCIPLMHDRDMNQKVTLGTIPDTREQPPSLRTESHISPHLLCHLNKRERITILLQFCEGYDKRAVARSFGVDPAVVSRLDKEARRKIRKTIDGEYESASLHR